MKTKYSIISLLFSFLCLTMQAQTYNIDQTQPISVTTAYVNNVSMAWNVNSTVTNKPLLINYNIGTESGWDFINIFSVDNSGNQTLLLRTSGSQSGTISTIIPNGKAIITFTSDVSVCYGTNPSVYTGLNISFSIDNNSIQNENTYTSGNSIVDGKLGIGGAPTQSLTVKGGKIAIKDIGATVSDEGYNGAVMITKPAASGQYINLVRQGVMPWSIGTVYNTSTFAIGQGTSNDGSFTNPFFSIMPNGCVGVGTPAPSQMLDVEKNADYQLRLGNAGGLGYNIGRNGSNGFLTFYGDQSTHTGYTFGGVNGTRMTINELGNVGVGTVTPNATLDVLGTNNTTAAAKFINLGADPQNSKGILVQAGANTSASFIADFQNYSGASQLYVRGDGNIGVGTTTPGAKLDVNGEINMSGRLGMYINTPSQCFTYDGKTMGHYSLGWLQESTCTNSGPSLLMSGYGSVKLFTTGAVRLAINNQGKVGIGLTTPDATLSAAPAEELLLVNGTIHAKEVKVQLDGLADYVFDANYNLKPLNEVEQYIKMNKHLAEMPSASEVSKNGLSMGEMQNKLLQKVEELTLYVIEQQKQIVELKKELKK